MAKNKELYGHSADYAVPPGSTLRETIEALGMDQKELAVRTGLSKKTINRIIKGVDPLSQETAIRLERATGVPARMWNNLEMQYRERLARQRDHAKLSSEKAWLKKIPVKELIKRGAITADNDEIKLLSNVLAFFGVSSTAEWERYWAGDYAVQFRRSKTFETQPGATAAWIRLGEIRAQQVQSRPYDKERFKAALKEIRGLTNTDPSVWQSRMVELCAESGVAVVFVPEIKGCTAHGLAQWLTTEKAMIQLCLRHKTDDHFWFTFFHEAGHILKDLKKEVFIDDGSESDTREDAANRFAQEFLVPPLDAKRLPFIKSTSDVCAFAQSLGIAPGIVVGQMQKRGLVPYSHYNGLKRKLQWAAS